MSARDGVADLVSVIDAEGRFVFASASHEDVLGWTPAELVGTDGFALVHPDDRAAAAAQLAAHEGDDEGHPPVVRVRAKGGRWVALRARIHPLGEGEGAHAILTLRAVQATQARERRDHALSEVLRAAPLGIGAVDSELRFVFVNDELAAINGLPAADHPGRTLREILGDLADTLEPLYERVLATGETIEWIEIVGSTAARPDEVRSWRASYRPLHGEGGIEGVIALVEETSEVRQAQRESDRLRRLIEQSIDFIALGTADGDLVYMNAAARRVTGFEPDESLGGRTFLEFLGPAEQERYAAEIAPSMQASGLWRGALAVTHLGTGVQTELEWTGYLADDPELGPLIAAIGRDVRPLREAELAARDAAHAYEELLRASPVPIVTVGLDRHVLEANPAVEATLGWSREDAVGKLAPWVTSEERETPNVQSMWRDAGTGRVVQGGLTLRRKDGATRRAAVSTFPRFSRTGEPVGLTAFLFDVEEREAARERAERSEERQQAVAELGLYALGQQSGDAVAARAVELVATKLGVELASVLALSRSGSSFTVHSGVGWGPGVVGGAEAVSAGPTSHVGYTLTTPGPVVFDDLARETRFTANAILRAHGVVSGISVAITGRDGPWGVLGAYACEPARFDETDASFVRSVANVVAATVERASAQTAGERALLASSAKTDFLSRMSHELRTPLNAIVGFGQLLALDETQPERREAVDQILAAGLHLVGLIDELLDVSQIEAGILELDASDVDLVELARESVALVAPLAAARSIAVDVEARGPTRVRGDARRLRQVLLNLLSNAIKYNRDGGRVVLAMAATGAEATIVVSDTGVGISEPDVARIFEPFQRVPGQTRVEGTGLGLSVSRGLVEAMGGSIRVQSAPGRGSVFTVTLPAAS